MPRRQRRHGLRTPVVRVYFWLSKPALASVRWQKPARSVLALTFVPVLLLMGYFLRDTRRASAATPAPTEAASVEELRATLETGNTQQRLGALRQLIELHAESPLVRCLASTDPAVVQLAIAGLWECWLDEGGPDARRTMEAGTESMSTGDLAAAAETFHALMTDHPGWAEAINKYATVLYLQGKPEESIRYCHQVVALKPDHFGAWNGMAVCAIQIEDWNLALHAVEESIRLQPHSRSNQQLLQLVRSRLRQQEA